MAAVCPPDRVVAVVIQDLSTVHKQLRPIVRFHHELYHAYRPPVHERQGEAREEVRVKAVRIEWSAIDSLCEFGIVRLATVFLVYGIVEMASAKRRNEPKPPEPPPETPSVPNATAARPRFNLDRLCQQLVEAVLACAPEPTRLRACLVCGHARVAVVVGREVEESATVRLLARGGTGVGACVPVDQVSIQVIAGMVRRDEFVRDRRHAPVLWRTHLPN